MWGLCRDLTKKTRDLKVMARELLSFIQINTSPKMIKNIWGKTAKRIMFCTSPTTNYLFLFSIHTVPASIQFVHSIFRYEFLGRIQFKFCVFYSRVLPKKWTFDQKMCIVLQFQQGAHSIQTSYCIETDTVDQLLFLCSDDTIKSLEQNDWLLNKSAILFWWFQLIIQNS